ncbi:MAG: caspase family protein [Arthrobacter sp.]
MDDYAVVVGVAQYPELSAAGIASDLDGPNNDATAVLQWLLDPNGGGLHPGNVKIIRSCDYVPPDPYDPQPAEAEVERALRWVEAQTRNATGGRLYLYFSGHGFSPVSQEGALFTAEATQVSMSYVYAHGWLKWFRTAQRFKEFVLWMDCCMNYQQSIPVRPINMRPQIGTGNPGAEFVATAAETKSAIEGEMTDGLVHGVFTWTLLQGLRGGAADDRGQVTAEGLKNFLHTVMPEFLPGPVKAANSVDLQASVRTGGDIVFARFPARPKYPVRLTFPAAAAGQVLRVWTGRPHRPAVEVTLAGTEWLGELVRGLYVAEVAAAGLRHGFQVTGTGSVTCDVTERGAAVIEPTGDGQFTLDVVAQNAAATITVMDHKFTKVYTSTGELHERDLPGVYKVRTQIGREMGTIKEEILVLDWDTARDSMAARALPSPAPIPGSAFTHESHVWPFAEAAAGRGVFADRRAGSAQISVLSRYWTDEPLPSVPAHSLHPMQGLDIFRSDGQLLAHMAAECRFDDQSQVDRVAVWEQNVEPGVYFLRITPQSDGGQLEASIVAAPSWLTQLAIKRPTPVAGQSKGSRMVPPGDAAVFMRDVWKQSGTSGQDAVQELYALASTDDRELPQAGQDAVIEAARIAFAQGRNLLGGARGTKLQKLLLEEFDDPIAGIIGGHLLLIGMDAATEPDPALDEVFTAAVARLRGLVRTWHPDVEALALRCVDPAARPDKPFTAPPMFNRSWQLIVEASYDNPDLVPASLWSRVHANRSIGPYFAWAIDEASRSAHAQQLAQWKAAYGPRSTGSRRRPPAAMPGPAGGSVRKVPERLREDARRLRIPAVAAEDIWRGTVPGEPGQ